MKNIIQKFIIRVYKNESSIINFILVFLVFSSALLGFYLYNRYKDLEINIINSHPSLSSDEIYDKLFKTINNPPTDGDFFASKSGKYYYPKLCTNGKKIKNENKIWFENEMQAISSGYVKYPNCP